MRILLVNPNTNPTATEAIRRQAASVAAPGTEVIAETAPRGPRNINSPEETEKAGPVVVEVIKRHLDHIDGAVTAAFSDPGLALARQSVPVPVVGIGEASMKEAARHGRRIVIVSSNKSNQAIYRNYATVYGVAERLANIRFFDRPAAAGNLQSEHLVATVATLVRLAVAEDEADVIIVAGGPLAGVAEQVSSQFSVPVLDCVGCAVQRIERWISTGKPD
jgi:allantoin racemase